MKKLFIVGLAIAVSLSVMGGVAMQADAASSGDLIKMAGNSSVYYLGSDSKRYVFPNAQTYNTWYSDFSGVTTVAQSELEGYAIGGNVTYKPGVKMVKITTDPKVYAIEANGTLRWVQTEALATTLYGASWNTMVDDVPDAFFVNYTVGADIDGASDYNKDTVTAAATSINVDKSLAEGGSTGSGLTVALASDTPATSSILADDGTANGGNGGQAMISMAKYNFTAASDGAVKVTNLKVKKTGISSDSDVLNAYLYDGETRLAQMQSISSAVITFADSSGLFTVDAGTTKTVEVKMDLYSAASSGKTIAFGIDVASDVTTDGATVSGSFPVNGNSMSVAVVTDLGKLTVATSGTENTAADTQNAYGMWKFTLTPANQTVSVHKLRFTNLGSTITGDVGNFSLWISDVQVGSSVADMASDRTVTFDFSADPLEIGSSAKTVTLKGDIVKGGSRTFKWSFQNASDVVAMDDTYNVYLFPYATALNSWTVVQATNATEIGTGSLSVNKSSDSRSGRVADGASNIKLATFDFKASGEDIKVSNLIVRNTNSADRTTILKNVKLILGDTQVGSPESTITLDTNGGGTIGYNDHTYTFGGSFIVPAGETKQLHVYADLTDGTVDDTDTIQTSLRTGASNYQAMNSLTTGHAPTGDKDANELTIGTASLVAVINPAIANISVVEGSQNMVIASWLLTAGTAEDLDLTSVVIRDSDGAGDGAGGAADDGQIGLGGAFNDLELYYGSTLLCSEISNPSSTVATSQTFNISPALAIGAGETIQIDVKANINSDANTYWTDDVDSLRITTSTAAVGQNTSTSVELGGHKDGQSVAIATAGTLTTTLSSLTPNAQQIVMGSVDNTLAVWNFAANNREDLEVNKVKVNDLNGTVGGDLVNLKLFVDGSQVGSTVPALNAAADGTGTFGSESTVLFTIPAGEDVDVYLKASVSSNSNATGAAVLTPSITQPNTAGMTANNVHMIARGASSGTLVLTSGTATLTANASTAYRTKLSAAMSTEHGSTGQTRISSDKVGTLTLTADTGYNVKFRTALEYTDLGESVDGGGANTITDAEQTANLQVDGTGSIWTFGASCADGDAIHADTGVAANILFNGTAQYSRVGFWFRYDDVGDSNTVSGADILISSTASAVAVGTQNVAISADTTMDDDVWYYINQPVTFATTHRYVVLAVNALGGIAVDDHIYIDKFVVFNDSIAVDVTSDNVFDGASGESPSLVYLKHSGTTVARGYVNVDSSLSTDTIYFMPISGTESNLEVSAGGSKNLDIIIDTTALIVDDKSITLDSDTGSASVAGDFRWYDGKVATASPITWVDSLPDPVTTGSIAY